MTEREQTSRSESDTGLERLWRKTVCAQEASRGPHSSLEVLRGSDLKYRLLADNASDVIWVYELDKGFTYVSPSVERLRGYTVEEVLGQPLDLALTPESYVVVVRAIQGELEKESQGESSRVPFRMELQQPCKDGSMVWTEAIANPLRDDKGRVQGILGVTRDISDRKRMEGELQSQRAQLEELVAARTGELERLNERLQQKIHDLKRAEEALRESEERLRMLIESADEAVTMYGLDGQIIYFKGASTLQVNANEVLRTAGRHLWPDDEAEMLDQQLREVMKTGEGMVVENRLTWQGQELWVSDSIFPVRNAAGKVKGVAKFSRNITELKQAQAEQRQFETRMEQAQKLESLGVLAGGVAHDFNNLLAVILGHAELAGAELGEGTRVRESLREIQLAAERAADLCSNLLACSGQGQFTVQALGLNALVHEMGHLLSVSIPKKTTVRYELQDALPSILADPTQMRQVILNLMTNAGEAIGDRVGEIVVATRTECHDAGSLRGTLLSDELPGGEYICLEVTDTGCGMDAETAKRVFEPFFTTKFTGRGLGLAAVMGIVRAHRGTISVRSAPDEGTCFRVLLPIAKGMTAVAEKPDVRETWKAEGTVLLVDDEEPVRRVGTILLEHMGFSVVTARDGVDALRIAEECLEEFSCVLLDLTMPRMDGCETLQELHRRRAELPVILCSGYNEQDVASRLGDIKPAGFIKKPYRTSELMGVLRGVLEG